MIQGKLFIANHVKLERKYRSHHLGHQLVHQHSDDVLHIQFEAIEFPYKTNRLLRITCSAYADAHDNAANGMILCRDVLFVVTHDIDHRLGILSGDHIITAWLEHLEVYEDTFLSELQSREPGSDQP